LKTVFGYSKLFLPKALNIVVRMAGLLAYSIFCGLPIRQPTDSGMRGKKYTEFTAAGTAPEFNRIPS
jgi:hypothetical protein